MIDAHRLYRGNVMHERLSPKRHAFKYPFTFFHFDISELKALSKTYLFFGYNQNRLLEIRDNDYLKGYSASIKEQLKEFMADAVEDERIILVSSPRYLGKAFNPVNFFLKINKKNAIQEALVEVNNTFGDRHLYFLKDLIEDSKGYFKANTNKAFHVSPYNPIEGNYEFKFKLNEDSVFLGIDLYENNQCKMKTYMSGKSHKLNSQNLIKHCLLHPFDTALNAMPRILFQAGILYFKKHLPVFDRPKPKSASTVIDDSIEKDPNSKI